MAAFGAPFVFLLIVGLYAWRMASLDKSARRNAKEDD
jgi:putative solute:sodium symporter small subunit